MQRTRNFATICYPENISYGEIREILTLFHVPAFISPLHNYDININNEQKKEHYHIMIMFDSVKTSKQAQEIFDAINGVGCEVVKSIRGYARYLCHLDNPEKAQYNIEDVTELNGANYYEIISLSIDRYKDIIDIMDFIDNYDILSFAELFRYCRTFKRDTWFRTITDSSTYVVKEYLKSKKWEYENPYKSKLQLLIDEQEENL